MAGRPSIRQQELRQMIYKFLVQQKEWHNQKEIREKLDLVDTVTAEQVHRAATQLMALTPPAITKKVEGKFIYYGNLQLGTPLLSQHWPMPGIQELPTGICRRVRVR